MKRNRKVYFILIVVSIFMGLLSRTSLIPQFIYPYIGDFFYSLMFFFIIGFLFPTMRTLKVVFVSVSLCYFVELLQLYQADWINSIRQTRLGGLVLGFGFLWSDIISYTLAGVFGGVLERLFYSRNK